MNYQGRNKLFISIGLTVLLLFTFMILITAKPESKVALTSLSGIVIILALFGVIFSAIQVNKIKTRVENLPESYQSVYMNAHELLGTLGIPKGESQNIMNMVLEIFEHANIDKRKVDDVIDYDLGQFLQGFIDETRKVHNLGYILTYATSLFIGYLLLIKGYKVMRVGEFSLELLESETLDVGIVVMYALIGYVFFPWLLLMIQRSAKYQWQGIKRLFILVPFIIPLGLMAGLIMIESPEIRQLVDKPLPIFTSFWSIGIGILVMLFSLAAARLLRKRQ